MKPPAEKPSTSRCGSRSARSPWRKRASAKISPTSPAVGATSAANQFQQRYALSRRVCAGYTTTSARRSAASLSRVPRAKSSGVCQQPCRATTSGPAAGVAGVNSA